MDNLISKYQKHFSNLCNTDLNVFDVRTKSFQENSNCFCFDCPNKCDYSSTHLYGCYESVRWDNKYIYYCPMGFIFVVVPILNELDIIDYGVIAGPILMGNIEDFPETYNLVCKSTSYVNSLTEIMSGVFSPRLKTSQKMENENFLNEIYKVLGTNVPSHYPIVLEKELQKSIIDHDVKTAKELLNKLLGQIFFYSNSNFELIKTRVLELLVLLSRSAIEGGADVEEIFMLNNNYIQEVKTFETLEQLSFWLTNVINRFVSYVFEFNDIKHNDTLYKTTAYIKENYMKKISLDDIASNVYLSKSYICKIFKEEMNISLTSYINKIRIEKSKILMADKSLTLVDIANLAGFEDQSYFTKLFKQLTNISPGKYREKYKNLY